MLHPSRMQLSGDEIKLDPCYCSACGAQTIELWERIYYDARNGEPVYTVKQICPNIHPLVLWLGFELWHTNQYRGGFVGLQGDFLYRYYYVNGQEL